jgi:asparagine synthase (glutamine-hydrolysing)
MCGICGKLNFDLQLPCDQHLLRRMMDIIRHRGPDGSGEYLSGPVGLGHRRLSIIDLNTGDQPMANEDGTVWVAYNGEIYNFRELRDELKALGHIFKSATDTEVIVHLYEEIGPDAVSRLQGMFAFALWDEKKQILLLARDRVGIKPLYFANTGRAIVFASEIKSLLCDPSVSRCINPVAIDRFLTYYYLPGNETLFEDIHKLDPGHYLTVKEGKIEIKKYWDLQFKELEGKRSFDDTVVELRDLLSRTVEAHMISDVPVGVLLSGGVDSTGVLSYAIEQTDQPIHTFTIGFSGAEFADERPFARLAAERFNTIHHDISICADDFQDFLPRYVWHMEEPICEPPAVALYHVANLARRSSVKVLLSGEGGDEAFGGYQNYRNLLLFEGLKSAFGSARGLLRFGFKALGRLGWKRFGRYAELVDLPLSQYYLSRTATPNTPFSRLKKSLYSKDFAAEICENDIEPPTHALFERVNEKPLLDRMLYVDTKTWLPNDLLVKADKMTMATSVELRVPLLDYQVLEFAALSPQSFKVRGWSTKRILKAALQESVPREILNRKKTGFPTPYESWLKNGLRSFIEDVLLDPKSNGRGYFNKNGVAKILSVNLNDGSCPKEIFSLLVLELWHRAFIDNQTFIS